MSNAAKNYVIDASLMQAIASNLAAQPWGQVDSIMQPLKQSIQSQDAAAQAPEPAATPLPAIEPQAPVVVVDANAAAAS